MAVALVVVAMAAVMEVCTFSSCMLYGCPNHWVLPIISRPGALLVANTGALEYTAHADLSTRQHGTACVPSSASLASPVARIHAA